MWAKEVQCGGGGKSKRFGDVKSQLRELPWVDRAWLYAIRPPWKSHAAPTNYLCIEGTAFTQRPSGVDIGDMGVHSKARSYPFASLRKGGHAHRDLRQPIDLGICSARSVVTDASDGEPANVAVAPQQRWARGPVSTAARTPAVLHRVAHEPDRAIRTRRDVNETTFGVPSFRAGVLAGPV